jgi:hypothetical protein
MSIPAASAREEDIPLRVSSAARPRIVASGLASLYAGVRPPPLRGAPPPDRLPAPP